MGRGMPRPLVWKHLTGEFVLDRAHVMGVLNVTPDSFSDGRRFLDPDVAVLRGLEIAEEEADILDVGGEATRPGADPVFPAGEGRRGGGGRFRFPRRGGGGGPGPSSRPWGGRSTSRSRSTPAGPSSRRRLSTQAPR